MSDIGRFIFGMFVFAVAICSSLTTVLAANATPAEKNKSPEKKAEVGGNAVAVAGNG